MSKNTREANSGSGALAVDMSIELGRLGIWRHERLLTTELAAEAESLGYGAIWMGGSPGGDLAPVARLLDATGRIVVATGIVNIWQDDARTIARAYHRLAAEHPGRFLLGVGAGHREHTGEYVRPYHALADYLAVLDAEGVPVDGRVLAALGPKVLRLAADRAAGAHPYLVTPEHSRRAREILGREGLLAPEQKVVLEPDPERARAIGRSAVGGVYLRLVNYTKNLKALGFTDEDFAGGGSDRLIDALVLHGDAESIARGIRAHWEAGADHVAVQALGDDPLPALRALAPVLR